MDLELTNGLIVLSPKITEKDVKKQIDDVKEYYTMLSNVFESDEFKIDEVPTFSSIEEILTLPDKGVDTLLETVNETSLFLTGKTYSREEYLTMPDNELRDILNMCLTINTFEYEPHEKKDDKERYEKLKDNNYLILITHKKPLDQNTIERYKKYLQNFKGKDINVVVNSEIDTYGKAIDSPLEYVFSSKETKLLCDLNTFLKENHFNELKFAELTVISRSKIENYWDLDTILKANKFIDNVVDVIKDNHLPPLNAMLYIHKTITDNFTYKKSSTDDEITCRTVLGAFTEEKAIVCSGFASMVKAIIDRLNLEGLSCEFANCKIYNPKTKSYEKHIHNIIKLNDQENKVKGTFFEDACYDANKKTFKDAQGFAWCLFPISDVLFLRKEIYLKENPNSRFNQLILNSERTLASLKGEKLQKFNLITEQLSTEFSLRRMGKSIPLKKLVKGLIDIKHLLPEMDVKREIGKSILIATQEFQPTAKTSLNKFDNTQLKEIFDYVVSDSKKLTNSKEK